MRCRYPINFYCGFWFVFFKYLRVYTKLFNITLFYYACNFIAIKNVCLKIFEIIQLLIVFMFDFRVLINFFFVLIKFLLY